MKAIVVRFKGHLCAAVPSGLSRHPLLLRKKKNEETFVVDLNVIDHGRRGDFATDESLRFAILVAARAIKYTNRVRRSLLGDHLLRGHPVVERLLRDHTMTRRGKRWKICQITIPGDSAETKTHEITNP